MVTNPNPQLPMTDAANAMHRIADALERIADALSNIGLSMDTPDRRDA